MGLVGAALFGQLSTTAWKKFGSAESEVLELRRLGQKAGLLGTLVRYCYADPMHGLELYTERQISRW
jgi:hypothetical protein